MSDQASELRRMMTSVGEVRPAAFRSVAIASGKGGVGKTNIALNLGLALAESGARTALVDADWGLSNTEVLLGIAPSRDLRDVVSGEYHMEEIIHQAPLGLKLVPGASGIAELANLPPSERAHLMRELSRIGMVADLVLLDMAPGISDMVIDLAVSTDLVLVITTPEPTALTDAYAFVKTALLRRPGAPVELVVNMASSRHHAIEVARGFGAVTQRFLGCSVPLRGYVCMDSKIPDAVRRQSPLLICHPRSAAANCLRELAGRIQARSAHPGFGGVRPVSVSV